MPFAHDEALQQEAGDHGVATRERYEGLLGDEEAIRGELERLRPHFDNDDLRQAALAMVAAMGVIDDIGREEAQLCYWVGEAFGFGPERISETIDATAQALGVD